MSAMAIVGKSKADADDSVRVMTMEHRGMFFACAIWLNPDDEESVPLVGMLGPFGSEREAERNKKKIERWVGTPPFWDEDTLSDSLRHRCALTLHQSILALRGTA
jgi:hypothetical protein